MLSTLRLMDCSVVLQVEIALFMPRKLFIGSPRKARRAMP